MHLDNHSSKTALFFLRLSVIAAIATAVYAYVQLKETERIYDYVSSTTVAQPHDVTQATIGEKTLDVPAYQLFKKGQIWALVSKKRPLSGEAGYQLVPIPVAHGDKTQSMQVADIISDELQQLVNAAQADDEALMVSSAYRSLEDQQTTLDSFIAKNGKELASLYVSPVGASEHHTGLSVDFSSVSTQCGADSNACSLSQSGAAWLAKNAHRFGFIQRYPEGKQPITGVAFEPWHFRFVGKPLANAMYGSDLTFDEVVQQIAPGYGPRS